MDRPCIGVDPGLTGAMALLLPSGGLYVYDMPVLKARGGRNTLDVHRFRELLEQCVDRSFPDDPVVVLEEVHSMPKQGVVSTFTFGRSFGQAEGLIVGAGLPVQLVPPQVWKRALRVPADKDAVRLHASRSFPEHAPLWPRKKDHGRAEAALLALFGRRYAG